MTTVERVVAVIPIVLLKKWSISLFKFPFQISFTLRIWKFHVSSPLLTCARLLSHNFWIFIRDVEYCVKRRHCLNYLQRLSSFAPASFPPYVLSCVRCHTTHHPQKQKSASICTILYTNHIFFPRCFDRSVLFWLSWTLPSSVSTASTHRLLAILLFSFLLRASLTRVQDGKCYCYRVLVLVVTRRFSH